MNLIKPGLVAKRSSTCILIGTEADKGQSKNINEIRKNIFKIRKKYFKS